MERAIVTTLLAAGLVAASTSSIDGWARTALLGTLALANIANAVVAVRERRESHV